MGRQGDFHRVTPYRHHRVTITLDSICEDDF
jgi:hypothetical protein